MAQLTRRSFILTSTAAAASARGLPHIARSARARHVVTLIYDKSLGMMRLVDRALP